MEDQPHTQPRLIKTRSGAELFPLLLTKTEAARLRSTSIRTIERLVRGGKLPQIGDGRLARFALEDLLEGQPLPPVRLIRTRGGAELLPLFVTKFEAAQLLSFSTRTIERLAWTGELRQRGTGRLARFAYVDLLAYVKRHRRGGYYAAA